MSAAGIVLALAFAGLLAFVAFVFFRRKASQVPGMGQLTTTTPAWSLPSLGKKGQTYPGVSAEENRRLRASAYYKEQNAIYQARRNADPRTKGTVYVGLDPWERDANRNILRMRDAPAGWEPK
jgi:hypothetical protein